MIAVPIRRSIMPVVVVMMKDIGNHVMVSIVVVWASPIAQRAPADMIVECGPGHPCRRVVAPGDPVPAKPHIPAPSAVVMRHPSKRIHGHPGHRSPTERPVTPIVGTPVDGNRRHPHVNIQFRPISPLAVIVQIIGIAGNLGIHVVGADALLLRRTTVGPSLKSITVEGIEGQGALGIP